MGVAVEVVERRVRVGLEIVDELTGAAVLGVPRVSAVGFDFEMLRASASRWFVEASLPLEARVLVEADGYLSEVIEVAVPAGATGTLVEVRLKPRTGYPFPPSITRITGSVVFANTGLPATGTSVFVTPVHGSITGAPRTTRTGDDGQYTMWFLPAADGSEPPLPDAFRVDASIVVDGVTHAGSLSAQPLPANRRSDAPVLALLP